MTPIPLDGSTSCSDRPRSVLQAEGLTRYFGSKCVVNAISFSVPRGSVFAFVGRNGAGKTTTIRMLLGLLTPTRGRSHILGYDSAHLPAAERARIGYMAEGHFVYPWMTVDQYAVFQRGFYRKWNQRIFRAVIDGFAITPRTQAGELSHGQRAGLHLAMTLAFEPELLVLDDPATGLDPAARRSLLEAMIYFTRQRERTIFFSTHLLDDVERVADYVAVLDYSVLRAACSMETFRDRVRQIAAYFPDRVPADLSGIPGVLRATEKDKDLTLVVANHMEPAIRYLESLGAEAVEEQPLSLEDALIAYVGRQGKVNLLTTAGDEP